MSQQTINKLIKAGMVAYEADLKHRLREYETQRAWTLMLLVRKAYTLLIRRGWLGRWECMKWVLWELPFGKARLQEYEIVLPDLRNYVPIDSLSLDVVNNEFHRATVPTTGDGRRPYDVVIMPVFDFEFRFQRPQQIAVQFARAGHRVFWVSPTRKVTAADGRRYEVTPIRPNIWEVRLGGPPLSLYSGVLNGETAAILAEGLSQLWFEWRLAETCAILQFPFWRRLGLSLRQKWGARLLYDCMDDWQNWPTEPLISSENLADERALVDEADVVVVTAHELAFRVKQSGRDPVLAPNAGDFEFFTRAVDSGAGGQWKKPIIGYYGAIAAWFDAAAVEGIARRRPDYTVVLIGQVHGRVLNGLRSLPNVHFLGEKRYEEIPGLLRAFDVALIPFTLSTLTKAVDPVKMYEYLSQGKPVVASRMPELIQFQEHLYLAESSEDFLQKVEEALAADSRELQSKRVEFARKHTWRSRYLSLDRAIRGSFPKISLIIVTYNSEEFINPFYASICRNINTPNLEIIFVDNKSTDLTEEAIKGIAQSDSRIRCIFSQENLGFAGGNNRGVREASGEYLVILNPDTVLPSGSLLRLIKTLEREPSVGMVAPVTNFSGNETRVSTNYQNVTEMEAFAATLAVEQANQMRDVPMIPLFCAALRRELWDRIGGLDEGFTIGMFEDDDFSLRIQQEGLRTVTAEDCFVHHFGNGSFAKVKSSDSMEIFSRNRKYFEKKWNLVWCEHQARPGVVPLARERRHSVLGFGESSIPTALSSSEVISKPVIRRICPDRVEVGSGFNVQPCGNSVIIIECENATPETIVKVDGKSLQTTFGGDRFLTALIDKEVLRLPGSKEVVLCSPFGTSDSVRLNIENVREIVE